MRTKVVIVLVLLFAAVSFAGFRRQSASFCTPTNDLSWYQMTAGNGLISKSVGSGIFYCPLLDDSKFDRSTLAYVNVHVNDTNSDINNPVTAILCAQVWNSFGSICGNSSSTTNQGYSTLTLPASAWQTNTSNFAYVKLTVCQNCEVYGFFSGT